MKQHQQDRPTLQLTLGVLDPNNGACTRVAQSTAAVTRISEVSSGLRSAGCKRRRHFGRSASRFSVLSVEARGAFTLLELLIVIAIMAALMVLIAPAFTNLKTAGDVTSAAYTIKGVLETARTYAKANNTYAWVGFSEENANSIPPTTPTATPSGSPYPSGRLVVAVVASTDGSNLGADASSSATGTENFINATKLRAVTKLVRVENVHLPLFTVCTGNCTGDTFDTRPAVQLDPFGIGYNASRYGELYGAAPNTAPYDSTNNGLTKFPFQYPVGGDPPPLAQYKFRRTLRFGPTGECRINSTYDVRKVIEVGLLPTHGTAVPAPSGGSGSTLTYSGNVAAVQITGFGGHVKIYRR
jgi:prepilin-type N-terminal cleavage/methylation domain-containing protein